MFAQILTSLFLSHSFAATATIDFVARTNVPGVSVEGKSENINVSYNAQKLTGSSFQLDVFDMKTGMDKRDQHLREKVFKAENRGDAKILFEAMNLDCSSSCQLKGSLQIKDVKKEMTIPVSVSQDKKKIEGSTLLSLTDFNLPRPSFMGVKVENEIEIKFVLAE